MPPNSKRSGPSRLPGGGERDGVKRLVPGRGPREIAAKERHVIDVPADRRHVEIAQPPAQRPRAALLAIANAGDRQVRRERTALDRDAFAREALAERAMDLREPPRAGRDGDPGQFPRN